MPWQLIYTSAPRGLLSGQSGFCTVARSGDLREALAQRLEQISSYHYLRVAEAATANRNPTVCAFRILDLRGSKYYVLTRIVPCGLDFTARTNHLAHHLVFQANELAQLPSPAAILRHWNGWLSAWQGDPRLLPDPSLDSFAAAAKSCLPAQTWLRVTGDAGRAAGLLESECVRGCYLLCPPGSEGQVLEMFCETLQLLNLNGQYALRPWRHPFTTFLQAEDNPADFQWRACQEGTPACQQAVQRAAGMIPLRSVRVPGNSLVKVAREGQKPPSRPSSTSPRSNLPLQEKVVDGKPSDGQATKPAIWVEPVENPNKPPFFDFNFSIRSRSLARIGIFVAVLASLLLIRHSLTKKPPAQESPSDATISRPISTAPPQLANTDSPVVVPQSQDQSHPAQAAPLNPAQLDCLSNDGPTYIFSAANLTSFDLPIDSIIRFQNLIQRFDHLEMRPAELQLSYNIDRWDFPAGTPLTVNGRGQSQSISARTDNGLECSFDYSNWKNTPSLVAISATFPAPPRAFSVRFGYSTPTNGDPFRLLIVNENNPPGPLHLGTRWLKIDCESLVASLQPPLAERLGNFRPLGRQRLQLQPFITAEGASQTHYLYQDWPSDELPPPPFGDELDFAEAKRRLRMRLGHWSSIAAGLAQQLQQQTQQAHLGFPLGKGLQLTNKNLVSFSAFALRPSPPEFIHYLNSLKKQKQIGIEWPLLAETDAETNLTHNFQIIYDWWIEQHPEMQSKLTFGDTNYFSFVWQNLKDIKITRQKQQLARNEIDKFKQWLNAVPGTLDEVAYVGLFIIDPPKPSLEMIRFQGP